VVDVRAAEPAHQLLRQVLLLECRVRRDQRRELLGAVLVDHLAQCTRDRRQRDIPVHFLPDAVALDQRCTHAVAAVQPETTVTVTVGDPGLVDRLVLAWYRAHDPATALVQVEIGPDRIVRRDRRVLDQLPRAEGVAGGLVGERPDRAQVDDVA